MRNILFLSAWILGGCAGSSQQFHQQHSLKLSQWAYQDSLNYNFEIQDTLKLYDMYLEIRHQPEYSFRNVYTKIYTQFPDNQRIHQVLSLELSDPTGKSSGKCSGDECVVQIPLQENAFFNMAGKYQLSLRQFMRMDTVRGIKSVAFWLSDTGKKRDLEAEAAFKTKKLKIQ